MAVYTIKRNDLIAALDAVKGAVPKKSFQPILTHVAFDNGVCWGFDSEVGVRAKLDFIKSDFSEGEASFNAPFERFYNLMKSLNDSDVQFDISDNKVKIKCGRSVSTMQQIVEDKFPRPPIEDGVWLDVPTGFKEALEKALLATSDREQEKVLSTVRIAGKSIQATDRTKAVRCVLDTALPEEPMLLTRKACLEIIRLGNPIKMMVQGAWSIWDYGNLQFVARLREGAREFPPVDQVFDYLKIGEVKLDLVPDGLVGILTRLKCLAGEEKSFVVRDGMGKTELMAQGETTQCVEEIDVMWVEGPKKYPIDALMEAVPYAEQMSWMGKNQPLYIKGQNFEYICSPAAL
jgi:DNA polymerase III sliding clamp (beta) subunit (PCNA family)